MQELELRQACGDDFSFLYGLHRETLGEYVDQIWGWDEEWQLQYFREHFHPEERKVIRYHGKDVGCVSIQDCGDHFFLTYLAILPGYQRRGIGGFLLRELMDEGFKKGVPIKLQSLKANPARAFYERFGFQVIEETSTHMIMRVDHGNWERRSGKE